MVVNFIEIYDSKKRNEIITENLRIRKKLKNKFDSEEELKYETENTRKEIFKPIIESNQKIQKEIIEDHNKIVDVLNNFNEMKIKKEPIEESIEEPDEYQSIDKADSDESKEENNKNVSNLIIDYLKNSTDRSKAGYSIRYDTENQACHLIN